MLRSAFTAALVVGVAMTPMPACASSAYDYVLQIKDGTSRQIKLYGTDQISEALTEPPADLDPVADTSSTSLCVLGEYDAGKTFLTNSLLGTSLASGTNYSTVGVSWKTAELDFEKMRMRATVYDFAGFGLPANTADGKRRLAFTENLLDDVAAQLSCLPVIVVPKLTEAARQYIDALVDHIFQVRSQRIREVTNGKSSLKELDVVVVVNNRLAKSNDQLYQEMTMSHVPLEPADTDVYSTSAATVENAAATPTDQERAILHFSRRTESVQWRGSERKVKFHVAFLRNVDGGAFSRQLLENARELVLRQARSQHRQQQQQGTASGIVAAVERSTRRLCGAERVDVRWVGAGNLEETLENYKGAASATGFVNPLVNALSNAFWAGVAYVRGGGSGASDASAGTTATTEAHRQYYRGIFELDYEGSPVSWQFRYGVGTRQVGAQGFDVTKVQIVAPGCGYRETAFETNDQRSFVKVSCSLAADEDWAELLAASPVGRSEWLIDYYEASPFCPDQTTFNNGIISLFFGTRLACKNLAADASGADATGKRRKKNAVAAAASFEETPIGNDAKGNVRTRVTYRDPADVSWTDRVASLHSERSSVAGMFTATVSCIAVFATAARSLVAKASSSSASSGNTTATTTTPATSTTPAGAAATQPAPARVSAAQWAMLVTVPGLAMIFLSPAGVFDHIAAGVVWAHRALRQLGVL